MRYNFLKTQKFYAKMTSLSYQYLYGKGQSVGITTTSSTLATHALKRQ
jgi:hypothetical protein